MCALIALQPALIEVANAQEVIIDPSGNVGFAPTMQKATKPQVIDIARANSGGVSLNQYTRFNNSSKGIVLNNSTGAITTQKAGAIAGNANLAGTPATTIVNEVRGAGSTLSGAVEIAGTKANVIVANPNGILCQGCSFINAGEVTLSTGVPRVNGGAVALDVTQGTVNIGTNGLNGAATGVAQVNLVGRFVVIDGKVTAVSAINAQSGAMSYDTATRASTGALVSTGTGALAYGIDATSLGAMEAGRITIVANEVGFGVRSLGAISATTGTLTIGSAASVELRSASAKGTATVTAGGTVTVTNDVASTGGQVAVSGNGGVTIAPTAGIYGATGVSFASSQGAVAVSGSLQSDSFLKATATRGTLSFDAYGYALGAATLTGRDGVDVTGATIIADSISATSAGGEVRMASAALFANFDVAVTTVSYALGNDVVVQALSGPATRNLVVAASGDFRNLGDLRGLPNLNLSFGGALVNEKTGILTTDKLALSVGKAVTNRGLITGPAAVTLSVSAFRNEVTGIVQGASVAINSSGLVWNEGLIAGTGDVALTAATVLTQNGTLQGDRVLLTAPTIVALGASEIRGASAVTVTASGAFGNTGMIGTLGALTIQAADFTNDGTMTAQGALVATGGTTILNRGALVSAVNLTLGGSTSVINRGTLASYANATLSSSGKVENFGAIQVDNILTVSGPRFANSGLEALVRTKTGRITTNAITNAGEIFLIDNFVRTGDLDQFVNSGVFASQGSINLRKRDALSEITLASGGVLLAGLVADSDTQTLMSGRTVTLEADKLILDGTVAAAYHVTVTGGAALTINGVVQSNSAGMVKVVASDLLIGATGRLVTNTGSIDLQAVTTLRNRGAITSGYKILTAPTLASLNNSGGIYAKGMLALSPTDGFANSGSVIVDNGLSIAAGTISSSGALQSSGVMTLAAGTTLSLAGSVVTKGALTLTGTAIATANDTAVSATQLAVTGTSFVNAGDVALSGTGVNTWTLSEGFTQSGLTYAAGDLAITAQGAALFKAGSLLASAKGLTVTATGDMNILGAQLSAGAVTLTGANVLADKTSSIVAANLAAAQGSAKVSVTANGTLNLLGETLAGGSITAIGDSVVTNGEIYGASVALTSRVGQVFTNGRVEGKGAVTIGSAAGYTNAGLLAAGNAVTINAAFISNPNATSEIRTKDLTLTAASWVGSSGKILSAGTMRVTADALTNNAGGTMTVGALRFGLTGAMTNAGVIDAYEVVGSAAKAITLTGTLDVETFLSVEGASVTLMAGGDGAGKITGNGHVHAKAAGGVSIAAGSGIAGKTIDLEGAWITVNGAVDGQGIVSAQTASGSIQVGGRITGSKIVLKAAHEVYITGTIGSVGVAGQANAALVQITAGADPARTQAMLSNAGTLRAANIRLETTGTLSNAAGARIEATATAQLISSNGMVSNLGTLQGKDVTLSAAGLFENQGRVQASASVYATGANIANRVVAGSEGRIQGDVIRLEATTGGLENTGTIAGVTTTALRAATGGINLAAGGTVSGKAIDILANNSGLTIASALTGANTIRAEGGLVLVTGNLSAVEGITLISSVSGMTLGGTVTAKKVVIDAASTLTAKAGSLRGSELVQVKANTILRSDTTATNRKLEIIGGPLKDVFVQLRTAGFGTWYANEATEYEVANLVASGSISLIASNGAAYLSGTLTAGDDIFLSSKLEMLLKSATVSVGDVLHMESKARVKQRGGVTLAINQGKTLEIFEDTGWFYTTDWLSSPTVNYNLVVKAANIVVNSDHRFVDADISLNAIGNPADATTGNIRQQDHVINARNAIYRASRDILIDFVGFDWRAANPGVTNSGDFWDVRDSGLRGSTISTSQNLVLDAGNDIHLISGRIRSFGNMTLVAGNAILSEPFFLENYEDSRPTFVGWDFSDLPYTAARPGEDPSKVRLTELRAYENMLLAKGNLTLLAGGNITLIGSQLISDQGNISVTSALGTITMIAAPGYWAYNYQTSTTRRSFLGLVKTTITTVVDAYEDIYKATTISAKSGSVLIASSAPSGDGILSAGTKISGQNVTVSTLNGGSGGNITLGTYAALSRVSTTTQSKKTFIGIALQDRTNTTANTVTFNSGNDLLADDNLRLQSGNNLTIQDGTLSGRTIYISAVGNLNILASINTARQDSSTRAQNLFTITTIQQGFDRETAALPQITSPNPVVFDIGGAAHIAGAYGVSLNSQLQSLITTRQFDAAVAPLYTTEAKAAAEGEAKQVTDEFRQVYVLPGADAGTQFRYIDQLVDQYGATYDQIMLRDRTWYDKQVQLTPAFRALLTIAVSSFTGGAGLGLTAAQTAAVNSLVTGGIESAITGNFDLGQLLRGAFLAGSSTYLSGLVVDKFKLNLGTSLDLSDASPFASGIGAQFSPQQVVDRLSVQIVNTAVSNVLNGQAPFAGLDSLGKSFLLTEAMGVVQLGIGDLGNGMGDHEWEGSLPHLLLHGGLGCIAMMAMDGTCASGFFAGASQSVLSGSSLSKDEQKRLAPLVGALAGFFWANGQAVGVNFGSTITVDGLKNNYLTHDQWKQLQAEVQSCQQSAVDVQTCQTAAVARFEALSQKQNQDYLRCITMGDSACIQRVRDAISVVDFNKTSINDILANLNSYGLALNWTPLLDLDQTALDITEIAFGDGNLITPEQAADIFAVDKAMLCADTMSAETCFKTVAQARRERGNEVMGVIADLLPIIGDVKGVVDCLRAPGVAVCGGALIGVVPVAGDTLKILLKRGDDVFQVIKDGEKVVQAADDPIAKAFEGTNYSKDEYLKYVAMKAEKNLLAKSPEEYIAARNLFATIQQTHRLAVNDAASYLATLGTDAKLLREVTLVTEDGARARTDLLVSIPDLANKTITAPPGFTFESVDGKALDSITVNEQGRFSIEVKTGEAGLTCNQSCVYGLMERGGTVVPVGQYANTIVTSAVYVLRRK